MMRSRQGHQPALVQSVMGTMVSLVLVATGSSTAAASTPEQVPSAAQLLHDWAAAHAIVLDHLADDGCSTPTPLTRWEQQRRARLDPADRDFLATTGADQLAQAEAAITADPGVPALAPVVDAQRTRRVAGTLSRFWQLPAPRATYVQYNGSILRSVDRMTAVYEAMGMPTERARTTATTIKDEVAHRPALEGGDNPLLSLGSFSASSATGYAPRVAVGTGLLQALADVGQQPAGATFVLAHEDAHQAQFVTTAQQTDPEEPDAQQTRRHELTADAAAAYASAHRSGLHSGRGLLLEEAHVASWLGDCHLDASDHHGTPTERTDAVRWGTAQARQAGPTKTFAELQQGIDTYLATTPS